jgi:drug/metabolite transporter (DMT)-like permease
MGYVFGVASAFFFASSSILFKIGQRTRPNDDGHLVANFLNATIFGIIAIFVTWPPWNRAGVIALVIGGILGTVFGRFSMLRGIRLIGPTRANTFQTATPVTAAIAGWIALGETISPLEAIGGALSIYGLVRIVRARSSDTVSEPVPVKFYLIASGAPIFFGVAFVTRKWGLERFPGSVTGAFIGSVAGFFVLSVWEATQSRLMPIFRRTISDPPWPFFVAGIVTGAALLTQFRALGLIDAWIVGILGGMTAIFTPILSILFLKNEEPVTLQLIANIGIVFTGVAIIAII